MSDQDVNKKDISEKTRSSTKNTVVFITLTLVILIIGAIFTGYYYVRSKIYRETKPIEVKASTDNSNSIKETTTKNEPQYKEVNGVTNVLLIGADGVTPEDGTRSDSILIATLDNNSKKVKLTSLYRDTYVYIPGYGNNRINAAYEFGGTELLLETIKETYNINIDKYVIVNFAGFEEIIDQIGGVEVDVKDYQLEELNKYIGEATGGNDCPVMSTGLQLLNGKQALSYSRIRKGVGDDFERASRQREVLIKVATKMKETNPIKYLGIMNGMLDYLKTNIEPIQALNMAYTIFKFPELNTEQLSIPMEGLCVDKTIDGIGDVLMINQQENSRIIQEFIYEDKLPN